MLKSRYNFTKKYNCQNLNDSTSAFAKGRQSISFKSITAKQILFAPCLWPVCMRVCGWVCVCVCVWWPKLKRFLQVFQKCGRVPGGGGGGGHGSGPLSSDFPISNKMFYSYCENKLVLNFIKMFASAAAAWIQDGRRRWLQGWIWSPPPLANVSPPPLFFAHGTDPIPSC